MDSAAFKSTLYAIFISVALLSLGASVGLHFGTPQADPKLTDELNRKQIENLTQTIEVNKAYFERWKKCGEQMQVVVPGPAAYVPAEEKKEEEGRPTPAKVVDPDATYPEPVVKPRE